MKYIIIYNRLNTILIFLLLVLQIGNINSQNINNFKQKKIPLNNNNGVPFIYDNDYILQGFEVDDKENFYFLGGEITTLACFSETKQLFRKQYNEFNSNPIYNYNNKLYVFDSQQKHNLFILDKSNGMILKQINNIIKKPVNSFLYRDSSIILECFDENNYNIKTKLNYVVYNLSGKYVSSANNCYNLPSDNILKDKFQNNTQFIGKWNNYFIFIDFSIGRVGHYNYIFTIIDENKKIISKKEINDSFFGETFLENEHEHFKFKNEKIYVICYKGKDAIITIMPIKDLFQIDTNH